ncbi:ATP-binding response regulator [Alteromonas oceanisediminis]|uniref:ATP-binding response regulator n=1 Tax=Alteromonas oceanisediminis TaxID=2836180 RepID=UPI001BDA858D|nr:HAMP domain-containing sensor histidine kinase [Alteromonas oceanisediminis]MBT0587000.1 response regulator [Alteromonas oceanisediminis]
MKSIVLDDQSPIISQFVKQEQAKQVVKVYDPTLLMQVLFVAVTVSVIYDSVATDLVLIWALTHAIILLLRKLLMSWYVKSQGSALMTGWIEKATLFLVVCSSLLWGSAAFVLDFSQYPQESVFLIAVNLGIGVGATVLGSLWYRYFFAYLIPFMGCFIISFLLGTPDQSFTLAGVFLAFGIYLTRMVQMNYQNNLENLALRKKNEVLAHSTNQFIAAASHDLRQPTQALSLFISALEQSDKEIDRERLISQLKQSSYALNELLNQILDVSKLNTQSIEAEVESVDLTEIFVRLNQTFEALAARKGLALSVSANNLWVKTDGLLLERLLANLLDNAVHYTDQGSVSLIASTNAQNQVVVTVADTGAGIDVTEQNLVFEPFYQVGSGLRNEDKGFGLGLSIVKLIAEKLKISLKLTSAAGQGARFELTLTACEPQPTQAVSEQAVMAWQLNGKTALVVDDNMSVLESLVSLLEVWGMNVLQCKGMSDAISQGAEAKQLDIILSDLRLKNDENGMCVIDAVRSKRGVTDLPALILSGDTAPERLDEVIQRGFTVVHKPIKAGHLRSALQRQLQKSDIC